MNLVDRIINESSGKNLVAEIYEGTEGYTVVKFINGNHSGESPMGNSLEAAKKEANEWISGVKTILG